MTRLRRTLGQLGLALVNATLILVVLCLFLAWRTVATVERVTETAAAAAAEQVAALSPVADGIGAVRQDIAALRADLAGLRQSGAEEAAAASDRLAERLEATESRLEALSGRVGPAVEAVSADPGVLIDRAVAAGVDRAGLWAAGLRGCTVPPRPVSPAAPGS